MNQSFAFFSSSFFVRSSTVLLVEGYLTNMQEGKTHLVVFFSPIMHALQSPVRTVYVIVMSIYKKEEEEEEETD